MRLKLQMPRLPRPVVSVLAMGAPMRHTQRREIVGQLGLISQNEADVLSHSGLVRYAIRHELQLLHEFAKGATSMSRGDADALSRD